jgi:hypothetical protein
VSDPREIPNFDRMSFVAVGVMWGFAAFWNGVLAIVLYAASRTNTTSTPVLLAIASPFVLAGLFLIGLAINVTIRTIRYRSLVLHLDTLPGVVGGRVAGSVRGAEGVLREGMSLRLACWRRAVLHDSIDDLLWEDVADVGPIGATAPFRFDVPFECLPTGDDIYWRIDVRTRGRAAAGSFSVPVERTAQSSPEVTEKSLRPRAISQPPYSRLRLEHAADGAVEVRFPRPTWIWKWWLFTFVVAAAGVVVVRKQFDADLTVAGYIGVAAIVVFLIAIIELGVFFSPCLLRVGRDELRMRYLARSRPPKVMAAADIGDFVTKYDNGARKYDVALQRAGGEIYPWLMISAVDKREAEWLAHELRAALK